MAPFLSAEDRKLLARLEQLARRWRYYRWILLACVVSFLVGGVWEARDSIRGLSDAATGFSKLKGWEGSNLLLACLCTRNALQGELLVWAGLLLLGFVLTRWDGSLERRLLLKVIHGLDADAAPTTR